MGKFTIKILLIFYCNGILAQGSNWKVLDTIPYSVNEVYIDKLNQIYLLPINKQEIIKLNENLSINQEYSSPFISKYIFLDVKDPMKVLVFLPQYANVGMYDESMANLSDEYFAGFNNESAICFFSSNQLCYFSENKINLRSIQERRTVSGNPIFYKRKNVDDLSQIKSNGRDIFLLLPGLGLWKFNSFLNLDFFIEDYQIRRMELVDDELYILKDNKILLFDNRKINSTVIFETNREVITTFAINKKYLLVAMNGVVIRLVIGK